MSPSLPPELDVDRYRALYGDLAHLDVFQAENHFETYGRREGRDGSPASRRSYFIENVVATEDGDILEIGPFFRPMLRGPNIAYLDVFDADELKQRAATFGFDPAGCLDRIDYVGDLSVVERKFAAVISSHAIEHQPDFVKHLQDVSAVLDAGGRFYIVCPDKRYCFDAFMPLSTIAQVLEAHAQRRTRHTPLSLAFNRMFMTHNDPVRHWAGDHGALPDDLPERAAEVLNEYDEADGRYVDSHAWYLTPENFRAIVTELFDRNLTDLEPVRIYSTIRDELEFCAVLEKRR